jgi:DNA helicase-2/ATP-dependent DNA helicase PcrA
MPKAAKKTESKIKETDEDVGKKNLADSTPADADERRLFYVAITRAKESVTISYPRQDESRKEVLPSAFIAELRNDLVEKVSGDDVDSVWKNDRAFQFSPAAGESGSRTAGTSDDELADKKHSLRDQAFVADLFSRQGFSPTALNNYLDCPWKYFYQNLIRIPAAQTTHQMYGIAVHAAFQDLFVALKHDEKNEHFLLESFEGHLNRQSMSDRDRSELLVRGKKALTGWFETYGNNLNINVLPEFRINGVSIAGIDGQVIQLTGVLDKIEFIDGDIVNVVDYKTSKPKTRNDIMGLTKSGDGNYYRQLTFYKLLLNEFAEGKYAMQSGTLDFIEPDEKGKYHKETFAISDEEVIALKGDIIRVADEIINLKFWNKKCDDKDCEFCSLRKMMEK